MQPGGSGSTEETVSKSKGDHLEMQKKMEKLGVDWIPLQRERHPVTSHGTRAPPAVQEKQRQTCPPGRTFPAP